MATNNKEVSEYIFETNLRVTIRVRATSKEDAQKLANWIPDQIGHTSIYNYLGAAKVIGTKKIDKN